jgi:hypothetical protein
MFNTAMHSFMPIYIVSIWKGRPKENLARRLNFIKVSFMCVNIFLVLQGDFCVWDNPKYIIEKHFIFLLVK